MAYRTRLFSRAFRATRGVRASEEFNEPGGRLFGEAIRAPGERRELFDWEVPYIGTLVVSTIILGVGLNSRPNPSAVEWAREEALARLAAAEAAGMQNAAVLEELNEAGDTDEASEETAIAEQETANERAAESKTPEVVAAREGEA